MRTNGYTKAIFGGLLWGDRPLRYIFVDEAGTSQHEPVTVVVGIIASADNHVMDAEALTHEILGAVPAALKSDFVFHATDVFGAKKYRDADWSPTNRFELLKSMMSVPHRIGMAVSVSAQWAGATDFSENYAQFGWTAKQSDLFTAFHQCLAMADRNIRRHAGPREVATVVAEDNPEMRRSLRVVPKMLRDNPRIIPSEHIRQTPADLEAGYCTQNGEVRVTRIRNSVHFVEKSEDPLVQVADACAFGFRRFFAGQKFGPEFARAIVGDENVLRNFGSPGGAECYWPKSESMFRE